MTKTYRDHMDDAKYQMSLAGLMSVPRYREYYIENAILAVTKALGAANSLRDSTRRNIALKALSCLRTAKLSCA